MATGSVEREYDAHLAALTKHRELLEASAAPPSVLEEHDDAVTEFALRAGPILARATLEKDNQQELYEELARVTNNIDALKRIEDARGRRHEARKAGARGPNTRKTRDRCQQWTNEDLMCSLCHSPLIILAREATMVCPQCGESRYHQEDSLDALPFGDRNPASESSYSRQTHLAEIVAQVQGIERTDVPDEVIAALRKDLVKHRLLDNPQRVTPDLVKRHLKRLKLSKWYDNAMQLAIIVTGNRCRRLALPPELVKDLHDSFRLAQGPYQEAIAGTKRKNYLAYHYFCHKRCQINGYPQYAKAFNLLKSRDKMRIIDKYVVSARHSLQVYHKRSQPLCQPSQAFK